MATRVKRAKPFGPKLNAFGETRRLSEWILDARCVVPSQVLSERIDAGMEPERAMTLGTFLSAFGTRRQREQIEAFGESKTLSEWAADWRCVVRAKTLEARLKTLLWEPERAITTPSHRVSQRGTYIEAFGEKKRLGEWVRDPRCPVSAEAIMSRIRRGMSPEKAITSAPLKGPGAEWNQGLLVTAFGETKSVGEWAGDPRCKVKHFTVWQRVFRGMDPELAITTPPGRGIFRIQDGKVEWASPLISAWGESKTATEWTRDPRCMVSQATLMRRFKKGTPPEEAMTVENPRPPLPPVTAFGETKSGPEWRDDPRMKVGYGVFCSRIRRGIDPETSLTAPVVRDSAVWITAWGETKIAPEWARDPRCKVSSIALARRVREWKDATPELIVSAPHKFSYRGDHGRMLEAFGESKPLVDWLADSRRLVPRITVTNRLIHGWNLAEAMTTPISGRKSTGRPASKLHEAFGERKSLSGWAADARFAVGKGTLESRIMKGWDVERAVTSPRSDPHHLKGSRQRDSRAIYITAFGETKTSMDWADDPRCSVSGETLSQRIRTGWAPEDAVSLPKTKMGGLSHKGEYVPRKNSPRLTAWGETKTLAEWARDPRAKATNEIINNRIKMGWDTEEAISRPTLPLGHRRDGSTVSPTKR